MKQKRTRTFAIATAFATMLTMLVDLPSGIFDSITPKVHAEATVLIENCAMESDKETNDGYIYINGSMYDDCGHEPGETVTVDVYPAGGYCLKDLYVCYWSDKDKYVDITKVGYHTYTFVVPDDVIGSNDWLRVIAEFQTISRPETDSNGVYQISNAEQLYWFAGLVNGTLTDGTARDQGANAVLTADITVNENLLESLDINKAGQITNGDDFIPWSPIGYGMQSDNDNVWYSYYGTFDGQGHIISGLYYIGPRHDDYSESSLFGVNHGTIRNVGVVDSYFKGQRVGGICGCNLCGTITNCYSSVKLSGITVRSPWREGSGGICGDNLNGTITNCYSISIVEGEKSCYRYASGDGNICGGVCGVNDNGTIVNCYYDKDNYTGGTIGKSYASTSDKVEGKTTDEFISGDVLRLLSQGCTIGEGDDAVTYSGAVWKQRIGTDLYPVLDKNNDGFFGSIYDGTKESFKEPEKLDGVYQIGTPNELYWFAGLVNGTLEDVDQNTSANAVLTSDIMVNANLLKSLVYDEDGNVTNGNGFTEWTPIGKDSNSQYNGKFDGQNHTISGLFNGVGLFGRIYANDTAQAEILNVNVADSYFKGSWCGGICAESYINQSDMSNRCVLKNCSFDGIVISKGMYAGGIIGYNEGSVDIYDCHNTGVIKGADNNVGGICGGMFAASYCTIKNCYNTGEITSKKNNVGGIVGLTSATSSAETIINCYNTGNVTGAQRVGGIVGDGSKATAKNCYNVGTVKGTGDTKCISNANENCYYYAVTTAPVVTDPVLTVKPFDPFIPEDVDVTTTTFTTVTVETTVVEVAQSDECADYKSLEEFASGEVAYRLNGSTSEGDDLAWRQTIGIDSYPVLGGEKVVAGVQSCDNSVELAYANEGGHIYSGLQCKYCGKKCDENHRADISNNAYEISNASELYWFANYVNSGNADANAVLTADIVVNKNVLNADGELNTSNASSFIAWTPIGNEDAEYRGTFDGQNHTISGLYFDNSEQYCVGLFGYAMDAEIKNVGIVDSYFKGKSDVGGVCGYNMNATITNSYSIGAVSGTSSVGGVCGCNMGATITNSYSIGAVSGTSSVGGVCGRNVGRIENCYHVGTVTGSRYVGGLSGALNGSVKNCYHVGAVTGSEYVGGVCGKITGGEIKNSYYDSDVYTGAALGFNDDDERLTNVEGKTTDEFKSGVVAYLLNDATLHGVWGQTLTGNNKQDYPVLGGTKIYAHKTYTGCDCTSSKSVDYTNAFKDTDFGDHSYVDGKCTVCGHFENGMGAKLAGYTLSLGGNIGINFYMEFDEELLEKYMPIAMFFTLPDGNTSRVLLWNVPTDTTTKEGTTYYVFSVGVSAKEMCKEIKAKIGANANDDNWIYSEEFTFKVEDYVNYILDEKNNYDAKTQKLASAMLNYGNYAEAYFDAETLSATTEMNAITAKDLESYAYTTSGTLPDGIEYCGSTLLLESETAVRHYFRVAEGTSVPESMTQKGDYYYVQTGSIAANKLNEAIDTKIGDSFTISYSAMSYAYAVLNDGSDDQSLIDLVKALYLYNQAALAYQQN